METFQRYWKVLILKFNIMDCFYLFNVFLFTINAALQDSLEPVCQ